MLFLKFMSRKYYLLPILLLLISLGGCKKALDFSRLNNVEVSGEWGIPLINGNYSIEDILNQLEENEYISQSADGDLYLSYIFEETGIITDYMFLAFPNVSQKYDWRTSLYIPSGTIQMMDSSISFRIPDDNLIVRRGVINSGLLDLNITQNILSVTITCHNIKDAAGNSFHREIYGTYTEKIDLSGYLVEFSYKDTNTFFFDINFMLEGSGFVKEYFVDIDISTEYLQLKEVTGLVREYDQVYYDDIGIGIFSDGEDYGGALTIYNPKVNLHIKNGFDHIGGDIYVDNLHFTGNDINSAPILSQYPTLIQISPGMDAVRELNELSSIQYSTQFDKLIFGGHLLINPLGFDAGEVSIHENSSLDVKIDLNLPFDLNVEEIYYQDIIDFSLDSVMMQDLIQEISFRCQLKNTLPLHVKAQLYFYNSAQQTVIDSLFTPSLDLNGAYRNGEPTETTVIMDVVQERVNKILAADKIILHFTIDTDGERVVINAKDGIKALLGMRFKYDM